MDTKVKPPEPRATDRLMQALSTLAALLDRTINEVKTVDTDIQNRLLQTAHDTEASVQQQAAAHLQVALEETARKVRAQVAEEMKAHFEREMTAAVDVVREELKTERDKLNMALERAAQATRQYEAERAQLQTEGDEANKVRAQLAEEMKAHFEREMTAAVEAVREELKTERDKLNMALERAAQATRQYEAERARLQTECDQANQAMAEAQARAQAAAAEKSAPAPDVVSEKLVAEIERVEVLIKKISVLIDDPATELSTVIRKNVERAELDSYVKGIRFSLNGK